MIVAGFNLRFDVKDYLIKHFYIKFTSNIKFK